MGDNDGITVEGASEGRALLGDAVGEREGWLEDGDRDGLAVGGFDGRLDLGDIVGLCEGVLDDGDREGHAVTGEVVGEAEGEYVE